jgi:hypothetical protein
MDIYQSAPWRKLENAIRQEPAKSVLLALVAGFVLCILPVGRLIGLFTKLLFVLIKPALVVLGVVKLLDVSGFCETHTSPELSGSDLRKH